MRLQLQTVLLALLAAASVFLAWGDPWADRAASAPMVSTRSAARRVFDLADRELARATIELQGQDGPPVRLVPGADGEHQVFQGDELIGPADPEALDGVWASLRMATTLRAVPKGTDVGAGQRGAIRISFQDESMALALGQDAPAANGVYGVMEHEGPEAWVVEAELVWLVEQGPQAWLSRRLLLVEPDEVASLSWGEQLGLKRGDDGLWRVQAGSEPALLSAEAVELRIDRLFSSRLDPLIARDQAQAESLRPWLAVADDDGRVHTVALGGACPEDPEKRLLDRGPGLLGCVPADLTEPWTVDDPRAGLLESRLIPYPYGSVLAMELESDPPVVLRRRSGGWRLEDEQGPREVPEAEVYRWFAARAALEIEALEEPVEFEPDISLVLSSDSGQRMTLRCQGAQLCARDEGPPRRVLGEASSSLAFAADSFADRGLVTIPAGEARAIEILPVADAGVVRQSAHLDMGSWRLDAPTHPDGDAALDDVRVEALLAVVSTLRAQAWSDSGDAALRRIEVDLAPREGRENTVSVDLYPNCVVGVGERRATVSEAACRTLGGDLLYDDPVRAWFRGARSLQLEQGGEEVLLQREKDTWMGDGLDVQLTALLEDLEAWRSAGIDAGEPTDPVERVMTVRRAGPMVTLELGESFVRVKGSDWYYRRRSE